MFRERLAWRLVALADLDAAEDGHMVCFNKSRHGTEYEFMSSRPITSVRRLISFF